MSLSWIVDAEVATVTIEVEPAELDMIVYQGDDFRVLFRLSGQGDAGPSEVVDLTGCVGLMQVRRAFNRASSLVIEVPFVDENLADGWVEFYGNHELMSEPDPGTYYYDAQLTSPAGVVRTFLRGTFVVSSEVSV